MGTDPRDAAERMSRQLVAWRRHLHAHPELSNREEQTAAFVAAELRRLGYEPAEHVGGTCGVVAELPAGRGPAIALRADMDALPIQEESEVDYKSRNPGVMHACGHDAHMAMLLGAAAVLAQRQADLRRPVKLIFQGAEELPPGGAAPLIEAGVLDNVAAIYGLHVWSDLPTGTLGTRPGPFMSAVSDFHIVVTGRGGHAAMPDQCIDPIAVAVELVAALQTVVSRSLPPAEQAVLSVTQFHAGTAYNIIPGLAELRGTFRTLNNEVSATIERRIHELSGGVAAAHGATAEVRIIPGYPLLTNDPAALEKAVSAARAVGFQDDRILQLPPQGGGEDFAWYARRVPGAFLFLGARNEARGCCFPHHHARFNIDETALPGGVALLVELALAAD